LESPRIGKLNRITGETTINLILDGRRFEVHGFCKPAGFSK
jgi:hypothetical protein